MVATSPCATAILAIATAWLNVAHTYSTPLNLTAYMFYSFLLVAVEVADVDCYGGYFVCPSLFG